METSSAWDHNPPPEASAVPEAHRRTARRRPPPGVLRRVLLRYLAPELAFILLRLLRLSWRIRESGRPHYDGAVGGDRAPVIAFLHGRAFMLLDTIAGRRRRRWFSMCSPSLDGDAMARLERRLGFDVLRGSSGTNGVQALVDMIRAVRETPGAGACLAVDGSRGPRGHVQGGILALAQRTGGSILPVTLSADRAWILRKTWDRTLLAKPFARVELVYGEPLAVPPRLRPEEFERLRQELEARLIALQGEADRRSGRADTEPVRVELARAPAG